MRVEDSRVWRLGELKMLGVGVWAHAQAWGVGCGRFHLLDAWLGMFGFVIFIWCHITILATVWKLGFLGI